jgi:uncharacterized cupredoxin-like copper-binding protein
MKPRTTTSALALAAAALVAAGCGSSSNSGSSGGGTSSTTTSTPSTSTATTPAPSASSGSGKAETLKLSADPSGALKFDKKTLAAKAGNVSLVMANPASVPHAIAVEGNGVDKNGQVVQKGGTSTVTAALKPGTYTFYCPVPGHRQAGMQGTLTVK